jgi:hypothetical protein
MKTAIEWLVDEHFGGIENCTPDFRNKIEHAKEMEEEQMKEMEFLKFQRDVYIQDIEILKARLREAEQNKN